MTTTPTYMIAHGNTAVQAARIIAEVAAQKRPTVATQQCGDLASLGSQFPPTNLHRTDAPAALRFYANRFATGETKRWDLAAHLLEQAAEIIEASRTAPTT